MDIRVRWYVAVRYPEKQSRLLSRNGILNTKIGSIRTKDAVTVAFTMWVLGTEALRADSTSAHLSFNLYTPGKGMIQYTLHHVLDHIT